VKKILTGFAVAVLLGIVVLAGVAALLTHLTG
jgi:hypothetical protein